MTSISQNTSRQQRSWNVSLQGLAETALAVFSEVFDRNELTESLGNLSAKNLRDIGLIENDVTSIGHLSLSSDASHGLSETRRSRLTNW